jgi:hypothetical protein
MELRHGWGGFLRIEDNVRTPAQESTMTKRSFKSYAAAAGLAAVLSMAAVTPSSARWAGHWGGGHWGGGAAIGAGIAGLALGAAAAATAVPYYAAPYGYYGYDGYADYAPGYYDYAPGAVVVAPAPAYYSVYPYDPYWGRRPGHCRFDIRAC